MVSSEALPANELNPFLLITFADLKKYKYWYWFAFPSFVANPAWEMDSDHLKDLKTTFDVDEVRLNLTSLSTRD